ncbi:60s acidic ribosomal protein-domain-containing protein [Xylaria bambusicola]|uniref:60s acidic ribosomal protein-domain-containing protein n=1 Tax=Xylaria bambusicola TaxID=326684 RepID=UPI00200786F2|nr:60s acidic ribosomal protein-domain-containing protein [Xylaria bambusicola]KAI0521360.1 60s acidic ribosomal protein-domain-containing protein [Xylaria bambusicola]
MKHLAAYLLLGLAGNSSPSASDIKKVLDSVGIEADDERLESLISELEGKDVNELIAEGSSKLASVPSGGAGGAPAAGGAAAGGAAAAEEKAEEKEEGTLMLSPRCVVGPRYANNHNREGGVRRRHGIRSFRLSVLYHLRQRSYMILGNGHKNGLRWSCMASGVEGFAFDHCQGFQRQMRYLDSITGNISGPASPMFMLVCLIRENLRSL